MIDFGLAKALNQTLTEKTPHTGQEIVLDTPLYMTPEQVGRSQEVAGRAGEIPGTCSTAARREVNETPRTVIPSMRRFSPGK